MSEDDAHNELKTISLLIIRHGIAIERDIAASNSMSDEERPLTAKGKKRLKAVAAGLRQVVPGVHQVASSPYVRAKETAEIISDAYGSVPMIETTTLAPGGDSQALLNWVTEFSDGECVALVGHEPDLGVFCSWVLSGHDASFMPLKKGGACSVSLEYHPGEQHKAVLRWLMTSKQLRQMSDEK